MFCYDVKFPERLSKKQQILRLYKNSLKRAWDLEITGQKPDDIVEYSKACREIRNDFEKVKSLKTMKEVEDFQEQYEDYIEKTFRTTPLLGDNLTYEWRHGKGLTVFSTAELEYDPFGYYSTKEMNYYPKPKEFEFREKFPSNELLNASDNSLTGWENYDENDYLVQSETQSVKSPEELKQYVDSLRNKLNGNQNDKI